MKQVIVQRDEKYPVFELHLADDDCCSWEVTEVTDQFFRKYFEAKKAYDEVQRQLAKLER